MATSYKVNFKHRKFVSALAFSYSVRKRNAKKCKNFWNWTTFRYVHLCSMFYYITHLCEMEQNRKFNFFQFFQKQNRILLLEYFTYIKNVIFWGTSCSCSSKYDIVWGGAHKLQSQLLSPPQQTQFLSYINLMHLKRWHFLCMQSIQTAKFYFVFEKTEKNQFSVLLWFT